MHLGRVENGWGRIGLLKFADPFVGLWVELRWLSPFSR